ncbi:S-adenosyl-L-methionine-dependent methyltransferase [Lineolata rhizophorae]|uniref:S-adenosyl-L-methionine-dependent methyltransferase n=1 Tax=Lineolata rhizophorae TaxID=578093 RepID=A0A6A6NVG1_9PEZI|nr:S-adenosyl-L-methionine-dependent methyltransferase [Lineolata rhizophorae]
MKSSETDSAYSESDLRSYATSLSSSVENYKWENGRRFHSYREGTYNFPNDELEQERLDLLHYVNLGLMNDKLFLAPIDTDRPLRVLDVGTGTGTWAMDMGDKYPNAEVLGNDLSPIQPRWVPPNVHFEVDDVESPWPPRSPFDFIHVRYMAGSIMDWPKFMRNCLEQTTPGGWIEFQDYAPIPYTEDNSEGPDNKFIEFFMLIEEACEKMGRIASPGRHLKGWAQEAGLTNVQHRMYKLPIGPWPKDKGLRNLGGVNLTQILEGLEGLTVALFPRVLGWSVERVQVFLSEVRKDATKKSVHCLHEFHVVYGQKPE